MIGRAVPGEAARRRVKGHRLAVAGGVVGDVHDIERACPGMLMLVDQAVQLVVIQLVKRAQPLMEAEAR